MSNPQPAASVGQNVGQPAGPGININLQIHISADASPDQIEQIFAAMAKHIYRLLETVMLDLAREAFRLAKNLQVEAPKAFLPPSEGTKPSSEQVLPHAVVRGTRGYIERVCHQINGSYENGWYDACAVMMRRLIETLIIEAFEHHKLDNKIKNASTGDFFFLRILLIARSVKLPGIWGATRSKRCPG